MGFVPFDIRLYLPRIIDNSFTHGFEVWMSRAHYGFAKETRRNLQSPSAIFAPFHQSQVDY